MSVPHCDPGQYKTEQRQNWDAVATGWNAARDEWWDNFQRGAQVVSDRLVELAEIRPGQRVLDVATGIGEPAFTIARRVGPTGRVVAVDQSPQMLAIARERAAALGLRHVDFHEMDAEALDLPEHSFDAILCRWGLMFLPNLGDALSGMLLLLRAGGRFAAAVWDEPSKVPTLDLPMGVVRQMMDVPSPPAGTPSPFSLADASGLEQALRRAGFEDVHSERMAATMEWPCAEMYVSDVRNISPELTDMLAGHSAEKEAEVWQALEEAARQYTTPDGSICMPSEAICVAGQAMSKSRRFTASLTTSAAPTRNALPGRCWSSTLSSALPTSSMRVKEKEVSRRTNLNH